MTGTPRLWLMWLPYGWMCSWGFLGYNDGIMNLRNPYKVAYSLYTLGYNHALAVRKQHELAVIFDPGMILHTSGAQRSIPGVRTS